MLEVNDIDVYYGNVRALEKVAFKVGQGEIVTLIGANGAGKSTILKTVSGLIRPREGRILYQGEPIHQLSAEKIVGRGISQVPEGRRIFPGLTVYGNLEVATSSWRRGRQSYQKELDYVYSLFPKLKERVDQLGWSLSGGEQQMLAIGRGLMARPQLLLLDEPSLGLAPILVQSVFETIKTINQQGMTVLLVEQNAFAALQVAHRGYVLDNGRIVLSGEAAELAQNEKVKEAYLGG